MIGTNLNLTFDVWFETLKQISMQDYNRPIDDADKDQFKGIYDEGLDQYEALVG